MERFFRRTVSALAAMMCALASTTAMAVDGVKLLGQRLTFPIEIVKSGRYRLRNSGFTGNTDSGLFVAHGGVIEGNTAALNSNVGIDAQASLTQGNVVANNGTYGISSLDGLVVHNVATSNTLVGLNLGASGSESAATTNVVAGNNGGGAQLSDGVEIGENLCGHTMTCP